MALEGAAVRAGRVSYQDATRALTPGDVLPLTEQLFATRESSAAEAADADVVFLPVDPAARPSTTAPGADADSGWTLGHVDAQVTAGREEMAAVGTTQARGVAGRARDATPWKMRTTTRQVRDRLAESRRLCLALRRAWPDTPHLAVVTVLIPRFGPLNTVGQTVRGIVHAAGSLAHLRAFLGHARMAQQHEEGASPGHR